MCRHSRGSNCRTQFLHLNIKIDFIKQNYAKFDLSAHIRHVYVLGNVLVPYNVMLITLVHVSSAVPQGGHQSRGGFNRLVTIFLLAWNHCPVL
jgi:hypothetical protein